MVATKAAEDKVEATLAQLEHLLHRSDANPRPVVLMMCGISGAGKSTHSKALVARHPNFIRLSMDAIIAEKHGIYGRDYSPSSLDSYQDEADAIFTSSLETILKEGSRDVVLDRAFYAKEDRDAFKVIIERLGGRCVLLYLQVGQEELWHRIVERREREVNADSAREISRKLLEIFVQGFEAPVGEDEIVIEND